MFSLGGAMEWRGVKGGKDVLMKIHAIVCPTIDLASLLCRDGACLEFADQSAFRNGDTCQ